MEILAAIGFGAIYLFSLWLFIGEKGPLRSYANNYTLVIWFVFITWLLSLLY